jgi:hypothetical protein
MHLSRVVKIHKLMERRPDTSMNKWKRTGSGRVPANDRYEAGISF